MKKISIESLLEAFDDIPDPRIDRTKKHELVDIIVIAICGTIAGAEGWVAVEEFGISREPWFRSFLSLPNGIPSHDTFGRVFSMLDPRAFTRVFTAWMAEVAELTLGEVVAIDGKTLRRSHDRSAGKSAIHMVSVWAAENGMVLGQLATDQKSNEITAIPKLLDTVDIGGCIVTIDAMGCQKKIAEKVREKNADYIFGLKGNQSGLHTNIEEFFRDCCCFPLPTVAQFSRSSVPEGQGRGGLSPHYEAVRCARTWATSHGRVWDWRMGLVRLGRVYVASRGAGPGGGQAVSATAMRTWSASACGLRCMDAARSECMHRWLMRRSVPLEAWNMASSAASVKSGMCTPDRRS